MGVSTFSAEMIFYMAAMVLYFAAGGVAVYRFAKARTGSGPAAEWLAAAGFVSQVAFLVLHGIAQATFPATNLFQTLILFSSFLILAHMIAVRLFAVAHLGLVSFPFAFVITVVAVLFMRPATSASVGLGGFWLVVHVGLSVGGYALFAISCIASAIYLVVENHLRRKSVGRLVMSLPSLETLARVNYHAVALGFLLFSVGMAAGVVWNEVSGLLGQGWFGDPKVIASLITWAVYALLLHLRYTWLKHSRKTAYISMIGFGFVLITFLGANYLSSGGHRFL
jgi:ABC-type transport system involved in cytochrome c biogenesis permease subunit